MQKHVRWVLTLWVLAVCSSLQALAAKSGKMQQMPTMQIMPIVAPLFVENADLNSTVTMVNAWDVNDEADFELVGADGVQLVEKHLVFTPRSQQVIRIGDLLSVAGLGYETGSVIITQTTQPNKNSMGIAAQLSFRSIRGRPMSAEEEFSMVSSSTSTELRGLTPARSADPVIAIKSLSMDVRHITVECLSEEYGWKSETFEIAPGHLLLVHPRQGIFSSEGSIPESWKEEHGGSTGIFI